MASKHWYVADFETTTQETYESDNETRVWLYAICDENANIVNLGDNIDDFMAFIKGLYGKVIYFHNLKFDGEFILSWLFKNGYLYSDELSLPRCFNTLIGEMGEFYGIDIKYTKNKILHIYDSLKLLPFKVEQIAIDFGLPILKGKIDYSDYTINKTTIEYVCHDVKIVAMALSQIKSEGMKHRTTASCAYHNYMSMRSENYINQCFPDLDGDFLEEWRQAYRGGRSQVNPYYKGYIVTDVKRYDINSMYPAIMNNEQLPYGKPIAIEEKDMGYFNFELYHLKLEFVLRNGELPSLLKKCGIFAGEDSYYINSDGLEDIWISNIDFDIMKKHYIILGQKFIEGYGFRTSSSMFKDYIGKWYSKKQVDKGAKKVVDKFMLNCLYGKFGSNHKGYKKIPYLDEDGIIKYKKSEIQEMKHYYLPIAIAVTSYAHKYIDDAIIATGVNNFIYCDTDSVHTLGDLPKNMIHQTMLGKFKLEANEIIAKYVRQKTYITYEDNKYHITCAGMTQEMKDNAIKMYGNDIINIFREGFTMYGKLVPKHVKGGIVLHETTFQIKFSS